MHMHQRLNSQFVNVTPYTLWFYGMGCPIEYLQSILYRYESYPLHEYHTCTDKSVDFFTILRFDIEKGHNQTY